MRTISPTTARRLAISKQRLAAPRPSATVEGILQTVRDLRCLQLDPINAVARSHLLVLWSRLGSFDPADLDQLLWQDRVLFEYWAHCASIVLSEDYPIHHARMRNASRSENSWQQRVRTWMEENHELHDYVIGRLRDEGPLPSARIEDSSQVDWYSSGWTSGRNVPRLLDVLWERGVVTVAGRSGQQRLWALADQHFPEWSMVTPLDEQEIVRQAAQHSLRALGVGRTSHIQNHFVRGRYPGLPGVVRDLVAEHVFLPVQVSGESKVWTDTWYVHNDDLPLLDAIEADNWQGRTVLLSPFDNLICDRVRTELLFDFFFRIEIYVPKAKRQYGYYVLPILHNDRLIGRIDPAMDRKTGQLRINAVYAEPDAPLDLATGRSIAATITELAAFLQAKEVCYSDQIPAGWRAAFS